MDPELSTSFKLKGYLHFLHNEYALAAAAYARAAALDEEFSSYFGTFIFIPLFFADFFFLRYYVTLDNILSISCSPSDDSAG